jgi:phage-related protein
MKKICFTLGQPLLTLLCGQRIVLANSFRKKTQKTPKQEIDKALKIKKAYESEKK